MFNPFLNNRCMNSHIGDRNLPMNTSYEELNSNTNTNINSNNGPRYVNNESICFNTMPIIDINKTQGVNQREISYKRRNTPNVDSFTRLLSVNQNNIPMFSCSILSFLMAHQTPE